MSIVFCVLPCIMTIVVTVNKSDFIAKQPAASTAAHLQCWCEAQSMPECLQQQQQASCQIWQLLQCTHSTQ
jgi:primosomal replication protein N